jgi:16S rRNA processing protein RimM
MSTVQQDDLVVVGRVTAPFGVKGWVKVHSYTQPVGNIASYQPLYLEQRGDDKSGAALEFDHWRKHGKGFVAHIVGCDDRDQALLLSKRDLVCSVAQLPVLDGGDIYWRELEGMQVVARWQDVDSLLGDIAWMTNAGASDVMVVCATEQSIDDRERWIPWLMDQVVLHIDRSARRITVEWDPAF